VNRDFLGTYMLDSRYTGSQRRLDAVLLGGFFNDICINVLSIP